MVLVGLVVLVFGIVFYATWQSIQAGQRQIWSYSTLFREADAGRVRSAEITGREATVTGRDGQVHLVTLSPDVTADAHRLEGDGVSVVFHAQPAGAFWLQVLVPNVILVLLIGGGVWFAVRATRRR